MSMSTQQLKSTSVKIREDQMEFLQEAQYINFSGWVREELDELMERERDLSR